VTVNVNFAQIRQEVKNMPSVLPEEQEEILDKIDKLEKIVHSKDSKEKKWDQTKAIIKWMADKGVDVGIAILPLLLQIK
jgi:predicted nucleotidyltransferase